jgi:hypothetical protein
MIGLTLDQKKRLVEASSGLSMDARSRLTLAKSQEIADRINKVLYDLHLENPLAFVTNATPTLGGMEFTPNYAMVRRRKFYNEPRKPAVKATEYASYVVPASYEDEE